MRERVVEKMPQTRGCRVRGFSSTRLGYEPAHTWNGNAMSLDAIGAEPPPHCIDAEAQPYYTTSPDVEWGHMHIGLGVVLTQLILTDDVTQELCYNTRLFRRQRTSHLSLALSTNPGVVATSGVVYMSCYATDGSLMQGTAAQPCNQIKALPRHAALQI